MHRKIQEKDSNIWLEQLEEILENFHFTTLNYITDYTLYLKLFEYTVCTLNYDTYYTLHLDVSFIIILYGTFIYMTHMYFV